MATTRKRAKQLRSQRYMKNTSGQGRGAFGYTPARASQRVGAGEVERSIKNNQWNRDNAASGYAASGDRGYRIAKNQSATNVRQLRKDISNPGNEYQEGTKEQVAAQHNNRYRDIRRAFGMSAG